ncbi:MAG: hypothetical protein VX681_12605 [Myxococcota bacterium]|nr:hypothetical protein [Myxococcota bacterium]
MADLTVQAGEVEWRVRCLEIEERRVQTAELLQLALESRPTPLFHPAQCRSSDRCGSGKRAVECCAASFVEV